MILTLHTCTVSVACGHHTSSNGVKDTDSDFESLSLLLVNQSQLDLLVKPARTNALSTKGVVVRSDREHHLQTASSSLHAQADNGCCPITLHFYFCHTCKFSTKQE